MNAHILLYSKNKLASYKSKKYSQFNNTGSIGTYINTILVTKKKPKLKIVFEASFPNWKYMPPMATPTNMYIITLSRMNA